MVETVRVEFECTDLPQLVGSETEHLRLGIQSRQEVIQDVAFRTSHTVHLTFSLEVTFDPDSDQLRFRGSIVQGTALQPFIYLCWGERVEGIWKTTQRAKFPLSALARQIIEQALKEDRPIRVRIRMTNAAGAPVAASLKPEQYQVVG